MPRAPRKNDTNPALVSAVIRSVSSGVPLYKTYTDVPELPPRTIRSITKNLRLHGQHPPPPNLPIGRPDRLSPAMKEALKERMIERPEQSRLEELAYWLQDAYQIKISPSTLSKALKRMEWSKEKADKVAKERAYDAGLLDLDPRLVGQDEAPPVSSEPKFIPVHSKCWEACLRGENAGVCEKCRALR